MKNKYRKYTKEYMKYLKFIHKEIGYLPNQPFRKLLKCCISDAKRDLTKAKKLLNKLHEVEE